MKFRTKALLMIVILLVVITTTAPLERSYSVTLVTKMYIVAFGLTSGRTGGYADFFSVYTNANPIYTAAQLVQSSFPRSSGSWTIHQEYDNDPYASLPSHPTTFTISATISSRSISRTLTSYSPQVNATGPLIATVSLPTTVLPPGLYDLNVTVLVNGTSPTDYWQASVYIGGP